MRIDIKTKNLELTEALRNFTEKKFLTLKKFINVLKKEDEIGKTLAEVLVELEKETKHHRKGDVYVVKCQIHLPGRNLIAKAKLDDLLKAVVATRDEMKMEIEKYKFKIADKNRRKRKRAKRETII
ncbi:MAG: HPF/RaiA family ribosome-associated protein [Candidatus Staskawiczbacteria bacterium]|nr:HPF/RaiA family ribosome-associated protein [Candidatus Staskawiczbacteria bacterium]